ncbi:MAG: polysaccharide biosynthesis/export family protein [Bryobacterales bacterium]|nr:polysaccharide biosynthesis/export family protein [Bryobacterales bacterium]
MRMVLFLLGWACVLAQNRPADVVDANMASVANLPAQKIAANDLVAVSVYDSPELTRTVRVAADGTIRFPMLTDPLAVTGMLPAQLERAIADALKRERVLVAPVVSVTILEYASRPVSVMGAVKKPLTFQAVGKVTLLDALARAEGLTAEAGPELLLTRPPADAPNAPVSPVQRIRLKALIDSADPALNVTLLGGEEIRVPEARRIYVFGNVRKPGAFPVRDGSETSILRMLSLAEGLAPYAAKRAYIYRAGPDSELRQEIPVELDLILRRKSPDVALQTDDMLYIPDNKGRRMTFGALEKLAGFGAATASGVLIWRR